MNTKCTKLSAILLFAAGGLSTVSAQNATPVVYQKLGENPFTLETSAALQIDGQNKGFLLPRVADPTTVKSPAHGLMILNTGVTGANQLQINIGGSGSESPAVAPQWVGFATSSPKIVTETTSYELKPDDYTVLFNLAADANVTLPAVTADNSGKIYVINRIDNSGKTLTFKIKNYPTTAKATDEGLVLSAGTNPLQTLNYAKKITVQANLTKSATSPVFGADGKTVTTPAAPAEGTWNIINMN